MSLHALRSRFVSRFVTTSLAVVPLALGACMNESAGKITGADGTSNPDLGGNDATGHDATGATNDTSGDDTSEDDTSATTSTAETSVATDATTTATAVTTGDSTVAETDTQATETTTDVVDIGEEVSEPLPKFSFFVTSLRGLQELSESQAGFGGDLRFGETGPNAGLRGADLICATIAEGSMPGAGKKTWRAFLSATDDGSGTQVDAIDRIGPGPWYDRLGRVFANTLADVMYDRPAGGSAAIKDDFPNEDGVPNHQPDPTQAAVDNHDMLTGTGADGKLYSATATCLDWTANKGLTASEGKPRVGHAWPRSGPGGPGGGGGGPGGGGPGGDVNGANWMSALTESGCAPGVNLIEMGPPQPNAVTVGSGGGYGGFYCFALEP